MESGVCDTFYISDHCAIYAAMRWEFHIVQKNFFIVILNQLLRAIEAELDRIDWTPLYDSINVNEMIFYFELALQSIYVAPISSG